MLSWKGPTAASHSCYRHSASWRSFIASSKRYVYMALSYACCNLDPKVFRSHRDTSKRSRAFWSASLKSWMRSWGGSFNSLVLFPLLAVRFARNVFIAISSRTLLPISSNILNRSRAREFDIEIVRTSVEVLTTLVESSVNKACQDVC